MPAFSENVDMFAQQAITILTFAALLTPIRVISGTGAAKKKIVSKGNYSRLQTIPRQD